jgi:hypothetical protein
MTKLALLVAYEAVIDRQRQRQQNPGEPIVLRGMTVCPKCKRGKMLEADFGWWCSRRYSPEACDYQIGG